MTGIGNFQCEIIGTGSADIIELGQHTKLRRLDVPHCCTRANHFNINGKIGVGYRV
ncbi:hypothetical protein SDC9_199871 [bioreactor metagenome]|uniref:Uncharacterized protein n=1 Tax=bioreactor metagenome TaxID=1076179 RepID=A0A645ILM5_9ZZZZ